MANRFGVSRLQSRHQGLRGKLQRRDGENQGPPPAPGADSGVPFEVPAKAPPRARGRGRGRRGCRGSAASSRIQESLVLSAHLAAVVPTMAAPDEVAAARSQGLREPVDGGARAPALVLDAYALPSDASDRRARERGDDDDESLWIRAWRRWVASEQPKSSRTFTRRICPCLLYTSPSPRDS